METMPFTVQCMAGSLHYSEKVSRQIGFCLLRLAVSKDFIDCMNGVVYVTYGPKAKQEAMESIKSLKKHNNLPVTVIDESRFDGQPVMTDSQRARWGKLNIDRLVDYDNVLYLDSDTRVNGDLSMGFSLLGGWDMALAPSKNQDANLFAHIPDKAEKQVTLEEIGNPWPLQLQAGVIWFNRQRCAGFFEAWRSEYLRYQDQDQAAMLRALHREPIRVWLVGRPFNGGELVEHRFGACR